MNAAHQRDFAAFQVAFDNYGSTHSPENRALCHEFWVALRKAGLIATREVTQLFDAKAGIFLADRFVKGTCPYCKSPDQYGDACEKCGATYSASDVKDPVSTLSGTKPEIRSAPHLFVEIERDAPAAPLLRAVAPRVRDEHEAHRARGEREEVGPVVPLDPVALAQLEIALVDERGRGESVTRRLAAKGRASPLPSFSRKWRAGESLSARSGAPWEMKRLGCVMVSI